MIDRRWMGVALTLVAAPAAAQQPAAAPQPGAEVMRAAGPEYRVSKAQEILGGENWRDLWVRPVRAEVLDLRRFGGGLTPERQGGGNQSKTLHFVDAKGTGWVFRSVNKFPEGALPHDLKDTWAGDLVQDQTSAMHPGGHFVVPRLMEALELLHVEPRLYVMPDDERLGEYRATFANMLGMLELKPNEGPDDTPGFAGATKVKDTEAFLEDIEESPEFRFEERDFLRARLLDFVLNDTDRGTDQWRFARFGSKGAYTYRPIARDRDWVLVNGEGGVAAVARRFFPKHTFFDASYSPIAAYTFSSHVLDRRLLTHMTRDDFRREVAEVQRRLSDAVIAEAVADLPDAYEPGHAAPLVVALKTRRDRLAGIAEAWYRWLVREPDLRGTDIAESATIEHLEDGSVRVRIAAQDGAPHLDRTFAPSETDEVRVYLHGGDDHAVVQGRPGPIGVRVLGGGGDDVLEDRAGEARFYDDRGENRFVRASGTKVSQSPWYPPPPAEGLRAGRDWVPDWGMNSGPGAVVGYAEGAGVIVGASYGVTRQGFRRIPYRYALNFSGMVSTSTGGLGGAVNYDYRMENSRLGFNLDARATQFEAFRFYGYGNDTPEIDRRESLVMQDQARVYAGLTYYLGRMPGMDEAPEDSSGTSQRPFGAVRPRGLTGSLTLGPVAQWTDPHPPEDNPLSGAPDVASSSFGQVGARAALAVARTDRAAAPRRGFALSAEAEAFPDAWDVTGAFGSVRGQGSLYLPLLGQTHLALRAGGEKAFGEFPAFEAAFLGGRTSLRGFRYQRFAGDAAAFGGAELRIPIDTVKLMVKGELGVYGLADAGRVWLDNESAGGWHSATGGGIWFASMGRALSLTYARGERSRWYLWMGLPF